jgi:hypothetical protein
MKKLIFLLLLFSAFKFSSAQEKEKVERACLNYIEGFYEGDTTKLIAALKPSLHKIGYWKNKTTGVYDFDGQMTLSAGIGLCKKCYGKKEFCET